MTDKNYKPKAIFLMGQPGAGKTKILYPFIKNELYKEVNFAYISFDNIMKDICDRKNSAQYFCNLPKVYQKAKNELTNQQNKGQNIIIDGFLSNAITSYNLIKNINKEYNSEIHFIATHYDKSFIGAYKRAAFEPDRLNGIKTIGYNPNIYNLRSNMILANFILLEKLKITDNAYIRDNNLNLLYQRKGLNGTAKQALNAIKTAQNLHPDEIQDLFKDAALVKTKLPEINPRFLDRVTNKYNEFTR